jgi:hypothetical protein
MRVLNRSSCGSSDTNHNYTFELPSLHELCVGTGHPLIHANISCFAAVEYAIDHLQISSITFVHLQALSQAQVVELVR